MRQLEKSFNELSPEIITRHEKWAEYDSEPTLKVLIIMPRAAQRETIELAQRIRINYRTVMTFSFQELGEPPGWNEDDHTVGGLEADVKKALLDALNESYDVIIVAALDWNILPEECVRNILDSKTALLVSCTANPPEKVAEILQGFRFARELAGKRRIVGIDYAGGLLNNAFTPVECDEEEYEDYMRFFINELLWVAGRHNGLALSSGLTALQGKVPTRLEKVAPMKAGDFAFVMWACGPNSQTNRNVLRELRKYGVDTALISRGPGARAAEVVAAEGYRLICYPTYFGYGGDNTVRLPCFTDPGYRYALYKLMEQSVGAFNKHTTLSYELGSESCLSFNGRRPGVDVCTSPTCNAAFRIYLSRQYGSLKALNAEWDTNYKAWDCIEPMGFAEGKARGNIAPWADHRMHMESVFAEAHAFCARALGSFGGKPCVGLSCTHAPDSWLGYDWWKLSRVIGHWAGRAREGLTAEQIRSFMPKDCLKSFGWFGGYLGDRFDEPFIRIQPWRNLFHGFNSIWWFKAYDMIQNSDLQTALAPDLTPVDALRWTGEELAAVRRVCNRVLNATRENDGIAIHYSQPSLHAATAYPQNGDWNEAQGNFCFALESLQFQYDFLAGEQFASELSKYRVLILPCSQAISDSEAAAIREFAMNGGMVIADMMPGIFDEHCRRREHPALTDIFDGDPLELRDNVAYLHVKDVGKGRAILINKPLNKYGPIQGRAMTMLGSLLRSRVLPFLTVTNDAKENMLCEVARFYDAGISGWYVGILPPDREVVATIKLLRDFHVYDMRDNVYIGRVAGFQATLRPGRAKLYAVTDQEQPDIIGLTIPSEGGVT